ncbi:exocyst complex component exo70 [Elasticomyces elasticus]|nr:exocyst complex component exo70 [Elasticomyces elasticus]KAK3650646.1 exocyst complex component exo70 [Elasticomyces elasticus]KAK4913979.1 exocyst complex component exo70 [Elasticomyces elasticus]KAK5753143.1 exocyst complex component exo70 [Elasticomyces elasticus]
MLATRRAAHAEESAEVEVLFANVKKMKAVTKKIEASMARLDQSGRTVQEAIGPVYGNTQRLQTQNDNIDRIQAAIGKLREPIDMQDREERILRSRPDRVGLQEYISSIDRTSQALRSLKSTNMRSNQQVISNLTNLLQIGTENLEGVFRDMLREDSQPIEPLKQITTGKDYPRMSSNKASQLRTVNQHIAGYASQAAQTSELAPSAKVYAHERGQYIMLSLQNLATASKSTARKVDASAVYRQGSNGIGSYAQGLQGMYTAEYDNICHIFSRDEWGPVLLATCQSSLAAFASTLRDLDAHVRENILTDCYLAYEIIEVVSGMSHHLESKTGELKYALSEALKPVRETAKSSLSILLNDTRTKVQQMQALPVDGSTVPLTTEVMTRLQLMTAYLPPLSSIMRSLGDGGWSSPSATSSTTSIPTIKSFDVGADGKQLFAHYTTDTIETLISTLESRSRSLLRGKGLQGVFLANNICVVERMIRNSELDSLLQGTQPKIDAWRKKASTSYNEAWRDATKELLDTQYTARAARPPSTGVAVDSGAILKSLNSKDRDDVKKKFTNFNTNFDELVTKHKSYKMEPEVRQTLAAELSFVGTMYERFWQRYHEVDKGRGKYVKYDKQQMSALLAGFAGIEPVHWANGDARESTHSEICVLRLRSSL